MELGLIIAIVGTGISIVAAILAMMFWMRGESNTLRKDQKDDRSDLVQLVRTLENFTRDNILAIREEMKDFHYRLLEIEKNRK